MRKNKEKAFELRKQGLSYKKISQQLKIPISTLSSWFKNEPWSQIIKSHLLEKSSFSDPKKIELMVQATKERWKLKYEEYRLAAIKKYEKLKNKPLFSVGIILYWLKGEKKIKYPYIKFANNNPEIIKIFYLFLIKVLKISSDKISVYLLIYPDLVESVQKKLWSQTTGIPIDRFKKSIYMKKQHPTKRTSYGVCYVTVQSRALKEYMLKWIELNKNYLQTQYLKLEK
jgi:hypothetical protein